MSLQIAHAHLINYVFYHLLFDLKFYMKQCISIRPCVIILRLELILQQTNKNTNSSKQIWERKKNIQQPYKKNEEKETHKKNNCQLIV